jgi:DNA-binding transcriptional LysR family regulator
MELEGLRALVAVVETGSFVAAARRLGVPRPTLRRRITALEAAAGVTLLHRSKAGSTPTAAGQLLAERGRELLRDGASLLASVRELGDEPQGELRVVIPVGTHPMLLATLMSEMRRKYPKLALRLRSADDPVAALARDVDVALAIGDRQPGGRWSSMKVVDVRQWLVASPAYLERAGVPRTLEELEGHELLAWAPPHEDPAVWHRVEGGTFAVTPALASPDVHLVRQIAAAGLGIAYVPDGLIPASGPPLAPVLPEQVGRAVALRVVVPTSMEALPRIRALVRELRRMRSALVPAGEPVPGPSGPSEERG